LIIIQRKHIRFRVAARSFPPGRQLLEHLVERHEAVIREAMMNLTDGVANAVP
jgi:hypothetical protein